MASFRPTFHNSLASEFVSNVYYGRKTLHYFLGKVDPWKEYTEKAVAEKLCDCSCEACQNINGTLVTKVYGDTTSAHNDPDNAYINDTNIRDNILYVRKVAPEDISIVVRNHQWKSGDIYAQWDDSKDMTTLDKPFYTVNSEYDVYKCLYNNSTCTMVEKTDSNGNPILNENGNRVLVPEYHPAISTDEPRGINFDVVKTKDGYVWKYMYSIPLVKRHKFVSSKYIPVQQAVDENFYTYGSVESVAVLNEGSGYSSEPKVIATVDAPKQGRQAKISLFVNYETGSIDNVYIIDRGSGYDHDNPPNIKITQRGEQFGVAKYPNNKDGAVLTAHILNGELDSVTIDDPGINYLADIETTLSVSGDGEGCVLYPLIIDGRIVDVIVNNPGIGYTYIDVTAQCSKNAANIEKAIFKAMIGGSKLDSNQAVVEQMATPGAIYAIEVTHTGGDYHEGTEVIIEGDGTGCTAHAVVEKGEIVKVVVDNFGSGYTRAKITFNDRSRKSPNVNPDAEAYAILPPHHGHGYDAVEELYGRMVVTYSAIRDDNNLSQLGQEFRQFGLISQLRAIEGNHLIKDAESNILFEVKCEAVGSLSENMTTDSIVTVGNTLHRIVTMQGDMYKLQQLSSIFKPIKIGDSMVFNDEISHSKHVFTVTDVITSPHINKYSGEMYYVSNNLPFVLEQGRTFGLKTYITM